MGTVPTNKLETELRKHYLTWLAGVSKHENDLAAYISQYEAESRAIIAKLGGATAARGVYWGNADFPVPKLLELSPHAGTVYDGMQQAAIKAGIASGLQSTDIARQILNAGLGQGFNKLNRLARTETVSAYWKNAWDSIADLPDLVMVWGSESSKRTCDYCLARDGLVVEDQNIRDHPNGRCTLIPTLRSQVKYKGTLQPDGSVTMDPRWSAQRVAGAKPLDAAGPTTEEQRDPLSGKRNPAAPSTANAQQAVTGPKATPVKRAQATLSTAPKLETVPPTQPRVIKTVKDMKDFGKGMPAPSTITANAAQVLDDYAKGSAYVGNAVLRGQKAYRGRVIDARSKAGAKKFAKDMDAIMDKSIVPEDVRVVRAVQADAFGGLDKLQDLVGGIYQDKGYMSTSLAEKVSTSVYNVKDAVDMEIIVPKGTRAVYMAEESYLKNERELLLDRGTNLAVESVTYNERTKKWLVKATVVPGPR